MYHIIELESQAEILFAHTYETRHYDLSFAPQEDYIEISYIERGEAVVLREDGLMQTRSPGTLGVHLHKEGERCFSYEPLHRHWAVGARMKYAHYACRPEEIKSRIIDSPEKNKYIVLPDSIYVKEDSELLSLFEKLIQARVSLRTGRDVECIGLFMLLLSALTDRCAVLSTGSGMDGTSVYFRRAVNYISAHIDEHISMNKISEHVGISVGYLGKIFKNYTGRTVIEYINIAKLNKVRELMQDRGLSLKEAGEQTGFENEHYLSRLYKKLTGRSAREDKAVYYKNEDFGIKL